MLIPITLFGLVLGGAVYLALRMYARSDLRRLETAVSATAIGIGLLGILLLLLRARIGLLLVAVALGLYVIFYVHGIWRLRSGAPGPGASSPHPIITKYLNVVRDAGTGRFYGTVLAGRFRNRRLTELSLEQLLEVRDECRREDSDAALLIEAFLDQAYGDSWRARSGHGHAVERSLAAGPPPRMTREEAYEVLGLEPGASAPEIREAHHRLMMKLHTDQGGSDYLSAKITQAKDVLLGA